MTLLYSKFKTTNMYFDIFKELQIDNPDSYKMTYKEIEIMRYVILKRHLDPLQMDTGQNHDLMGQFHDRFYVRKDQRLEKAFNLHKLIILVHHVLPFIKHTDDTEFKKMIFKELTSRLTRYEQRAVAVFNCVLILKYDLFDIHNGKALEEMKSEAVEFLQKFFKFWDRLTVVYMLERVYELNLLSKEQTKTIDEEYKLFETVESSDIFTCQKRSIKDLYSLMDSVKVLKMFFNADKIEHSLDLLGNKDLSISIEEYYNLAIIKSGLNYNDPALASGKVKMPCLDSVAAMVRFYHKFNKNDEFIG
jgi:hypothetical protein